MNWNELQQTNRPIVLYGTGDGAEKVLAQLSARGIIPAAIFASDGFVRNRVFAGAPVISYAQAKELYPNMIILLCFGSHDPMVLEQLRRMNAEQEMYVPAFPVIGDGLFTEEYVQMHAAEIEKTAALLADEKSRQVLREIIAYRLDGRISHLEHCETPDTENWALLTPGAQERFMDLGAYTGDTMQQFLTLAGGYERIWAVEPDARNFLKLTEYAGGMENVTLLHMAVGSEHGTVAFSKDAGRGGRLGCGTVMVEADSVDHILQGEAVSFIKMDLEGQERVAIAGAAEAIRCCRPKLLIAAYHRNEDLWAIPEQVLALQPDYRVYLRKSPCIPDWEINYYFNPF